MAKLREGLFPGGGPISRDVVGLTAAQVGALMGFNFPEEAKSIFVKAEGIGRAEYLFREKLCP